MKRLLFFITGLLLTGVLSAQGVSQCEYWFDQDYANHQVVTVVNDSLHWRTGRPMRPTSAQGFTA